MFHLFTTTTQMHYYHPEVGIRRNNRIFKFFSGQFGFPADCVLDIDMGVDSYVSVNLPSHNIEYIGFLTEVELRSIYQLILEAGKISKMIKRDILHSLRKQDITGLKSV